MKLQGRVGIVTGAGSGMGKAAVDEMTAQGATVYAVDLQGTLWLSLREQRIGAVIRCRCDRFSTTCRDYLRA